MAETKAEIEKKNEDLTAQNEGLAAQMSEKDKEIEALKAQLAAAQGNAPKKKTDMVEVYIPKDPNDQGDQKQFVAINGHSWLVKRGVWVAVPRDVAEVIKNAEEQTQIAEALMEQLAGSYDEKLSKL